MILQYDEHIEKYEKASEVIEETFAIDTNELAMKCISQVLEDSIDPKEKANFYTNEIERIFGDIVNKDVTQASLRLAND